jgi:hypothetical protein
MHEPGVLPRQLAIERPVVGIRADGDHRLQSSFAAASERHWQITAPGKGFEMRVCVDQTHDLFSVILSDAKDPRP